MARSNQRQSITLAARARVTRRALPDAERPARPAGRIQEDARIERACRHLVDHALSPAGQLSTSGTPSTSIDCLQGNLCWALLELGFADPRLANALQLIADKQDDLGRWSLEYDYTGKTWVDFGVKKQPNKWVTLRALIVLKAAA
jgi:hypothetical protein